MNATPHFFFLEKCDATKIFRTSELQHHRCNYQNKYSKQKKKKHIWEMKQPFSDFQGS